MRRLVAGLALLTSIAACLVIAGIGLTALIIENSGERLGGAFLAVAGSLSCAATMVLIFARKGAFAGGGGRLGALAAALLGALPVAALGVAAVIFSGIPLGSAVPLFDWSMFAVGIVLLLGAVSILALGYGRTKEARTVPSRPAGRVAPAPERPKRRAAPAPLRRRRRSPEADTSGPTANSAGPSPTQDREDEEDIRVTPIELPSIGRFRHR